MAPAGPTVVPIAVARNGRAGKGFEAEHRSHTALDAPIILLDAIVQVSTFPDCDRLQPVPGAFLQAICRVAGHDRLVVGLAAVDDDAIGTAMAVQRLAEEALGRRQVPVLAEIEFNRVAHAVDGTIEIHPPPRTLM